ncbi:uncharacterized protein FTJAE_7968 [Fusarium tjaetaba]|uniref:Uncharacterized protein n=1 Tax=Fusarium tjaetaba TaxID=1567544 RepID=A0A8H5REJ5_9HYPO|nr:uncharacterized protein FTJAE_7968 [Fusarium tjaetaba]KAF5631102.1 hypothetical protein FTJAE_7968 [Fusarium tjaetaba]
MAQFSEEIRYLLEDMSLSEDMLQTCEEMSPVSEDIPILEDLPQILEMSQISEETMHELKKKLIFDRVPAAIIARSCLAILKSMISLSYSSVMLFIDKYNESRLRRKFEEIQKFQELTRSFSDDENDDHLEFIRSFADDEKDDHPDFNQDRKGSLLLYAASVMPVSWYLRNHNDASGLFIEQATTIRMCCLDELKQHYGNSFMDSSDDDDGRALYHRMLQEMEALRMKHLRVPVTDDVVSVALRTYKDCRDLDLPAPEGLAIHALSPLDTGKEWLVQEVEISSEPDSYPDGTTIEAITLTRDQLRAHYKGAGFKKEVPATHPTLDNLDLDFDKEISCEYGIVVAWRFVGSEAWMDRYGHLVSQDPLLRDNLGYPGQVNRAYSSE